MIFFIYSLTFYRCVVNFSSEYFEYKTDWYSRFSFGDRALVVLVLGYLYF